MIELYHNDMSVCAQKVRFALGEKALQWKSRHLNLRAGDQQKPEYVKLNPDAVVPTLVDGGNVIIESTVICEYLDDAYPEPSLSPRNPVERARMRLWTKQLDESVHAATRTISNAIAFRHQKLALGTEALTALHDKIPDPKKRAESWENVHKGVDSSYFADAARRFEKLLSDMESALSASLGWREAVFPWPISAMRRIFCACKISSFSSCGTNNPISPHGSKRSASGPATKPPSTTGTTNPMQC